MIELAKQVLKVPFFRSAICGFGLLTAGCSTTPEIGGAPGITVVDLQELPAPQGVDPLAPTRPYVIGPGDELLLDVVGIENLNDRKIVVDSAGFISVPLAGVINANGQTAATLESLIIERMRAGYVRDPIVSVNISEARSRTVSVDGQVGRPGVYPVIGRTSLMQMIARAEGTEEFARLNDVVVFRTVGDQRMVALYNLSAIRRGNYADPQIYADDVIVVGESRGRRMFQTLIQAGSLLTGPLIALVQNN